MDSLSFLSRADLEAENARLRTALAALGADPDEPPQHRPERDAPGTATSEAMAAELAASRAALRASEERLHFAFEASGSIGWWDWDIRGDRLYAGERFARMLGIAPAAAAAGAPVGAVLDRVHPEDRARVSRRFHAAVGAAGEFREEYRLRGPDGTVTWICAHGRCFHDPAGRPTRYPGVALDVTARRAEESHRAALLELDEAARDLRAIPEVTRAAAAIAGRTLEVDWSGLARVDASREAAETEAGWAADAAAVAGPPWPDGYAAVYAAIGEEPLVVADLLADARTDPGPLRALGVRAHAAVPVREGGRTVAVLFVQDRRPRAWSAEALAFLRGVADRVEVAVARLRAEEQQRMLNHELSHRLKNALTLVQSIAAQTLRNAADLDAAQAALTPRLVALGKAHDVLLAGPRQSARVPDVIRAALALHEDTADRFRIDGPDVLIGPAAALSLGLVLHELATNATKYGALSNRDGAVSVAWAVEEAPGRPVFRLDWIERGGPVVTPPTRKGFGSRLIERGVAGGDVAMRYAPDGVACTLRTPLAAFQAG